MKMLLPYLMLPLLALGGWLLSLWLWAPQFLQKPNVLRLDAPPALGVVIAVPGSQTPVKVNMDALLPPTAKSAVSTSSGVAVAFPNVSAIMVDGRRKVALVDGMPLTVGEHFSQFRVTAIEGHRVQFSHPGTRQKRWIAVPDQ